MIRRVYGAYTVELTKAIRSRSTYVGVALVLLAIISAVIAQPIRRDGDSDYEFIAYATPLAINVLGLFVLLIYCAGLVSPELSSGTIRTVLVRPLRRREFILAKMLTGMTYACVISLVTAVSTWGLAYGLGDLSGIRFAGDVIYTDREMQLSYISALGYNLLPQFAAASYAIMISTFTRNTPLAAALAVGLWLVVDVAKHALNVAPLVFSYYMESAWEPFANRCRALDDFTSAPIHMGVITSVASIIVFTLVAMIVLSRRNLSE